MLLPVVSIITPTYNHERYIVACIESVLKQTYQDWEMIIIDDDSTDHTAQVIKKFSDSRIRYVHQEHLGVYKLGVTYNKALAMARGEIIAILEGDDFWPDYKLEHQIPFFNDANVVLSYGDAYEIDCSGKIIRYCPIDINSAQVRANKPVGYSLQTFLKPCSFIHSPTVCLRKEALLKIGGFIQPPLVPAVDFATWCRLALEGEFYYLPEILGNWRRHPKNISLEKESELLQGGIRYAQYFIDSYEQKIKGLPLNLEVLREQLKISITKVENSKEYRQGIRHLEIWEKQSARGYFLQYLKRHKKRFTLSLMSLVGIFVSYLNINLIHLISMVVGLMRRYTNKNQNQC